MQVEDVHVRGQGDVAEACTLVALPLPLTLPLTRLERVPLPLQDPGFHSGVGEASQRTAEALTLYEGPMCMRALKNHSR